METKSVFKPVVRHKTTKDIYFYEGGNKFTNIRTKVSGEISDIAARKSFIINPELSILLNEFPNIAKLINRLNLITENI